MAMVEWLRQLGLYQLISRFAIIYALYAPIQDTYKESQSLKGLATERREDNVETVENRDTVLTIRVWQYRQGADQDRHRISVCRGNQL